MKSETLEDYLAGEFHQDMDDVRELEDTLRATQTVFVHSCDDGLWPYERRAAHAADLPDKPSHGTQAMIAAALGKMTGQCAMQSGAPTRLGIKSDTPLGLCQNEGTTRLIKSIEQGTLVSGTFGENDPVTLSHVTELIRGLDVAGNRDDASKLWKTIPAAEKVLSSLIRDNPAVSRKLLPKLPLFRSESPQTTPGQKETFPAGSKPDYVVNAFVPLRIIRSIHNLARARESAPGTATKFAELADPKFDQYRKFFESTLYDQLSFSAIPDSRFDAAELIFCLEGLLLCGKQSVDDRVFGHVLKVLREKQDLSAQWRPNRPIFATQQGMTMLPVSVESAVSLVRSIEIMDRRQTYHQFSALGSDLARRFWHWLRAHKVQFLAPPVSGGDDVEVTGWHSEHVNDPSLIHLWDTSQVIEFMLGYREMLQRKVAGRTLLLSRLKIDKQPIGKPVDWKARWAEKAKAFEPRSGGEKRVYIDRLTAEFVVPWGDGKPPNFSMLLFGPPGTGKSSVAENIADTLGMLMITVTVSDFLGRGGGNVEARAKAIFQTLEAQTDAVILFDEIDSFLLDRDSKRYRKQDSLFQFLTPGMLTKLNDLRKRERSIFIIATNYENRIDPAIKRRGRIDQRYLLSLPDAQKRLEIIKGLRGTSVAAEKQDEVKKKTLFFGFSDLKSLVIDAGPGDDNLLRLLASGDFEAATSIRSYLGRHAEANFPMEELRDLESLKKETDPTFDADTELQRIRDDVTERNSELVVTSTKVVEA